MNVAAILGKAYRLTNKSATTFLDGSATNILAELNICYKARALDILKVKGDINSFVKEIKEDLISTSGLVIGNTGYNGEYPFQSDVLRPVRVEISYDATNWYPAEVYDLNSNPSSEHNQNQIQDSFFETRPFVRFERDSYFVRPLKTSAGNVTGGIHIWYEKRLDDLTTGSPEFEESLHDILAYDLAYLERLMHPEFYTTEWRVDFDTQHAKAQTRFNDFYKNRFKRNMTMKSLPTGNNRYN